MTGPVIRPCCFTPVAAEHHVDCKKVNASAVEAKPPANDPVNHPSHYNGVVPGVECIDVVEHFNFCRGNAIKYLWRAGLKGDLVEDLKKAVFYIQREIDSVEKNGL